MNETLSCNWAIALAEAKGLPPALLVVVNGFLALVAISALVGIWFGRSGE
jgi:hypothetical protein